MTPRVLAVVAIATALAWPAPILAQPQIGGCAVFPADSIWNTRADSLPVHPQSDEYVAAIGAARAPHPDFGAGEWEGGPIGIPFVVVPPDQPPVPIVLGDYADESDPGPYPVPADAPVEGGPNAQGDRHVLVLQQGTCRVYELYKAYLLPGSGWSADSAAIFDLTGYALRPAGWTSADAAGLPVLPGLVRYDEVASGEIAHALRMTAPATQRAYVWPARHFASSIADPAYPPMGQRFRLRADLDLTPYSPPVQVILRAMQRYGLILADNGSPWYISGAPDPRWNDDLLREIRTLRGTDFEAVDSAGLMISIDSSQARQPSSVPMHVTYLPLIHDP